MFITLTTSISEEISEEKQDVFNCNYIILDMTHVYHHQRVSFLLQFWMKLFLAPPSPSQGCPGPRKVKHLNSYTYSLTMYFSICPSPLLSFYQDRYALCLSLSHIFIFYCHTLNVILKIFPSHCFLSVSSFSRSSCPASLIYPGQDISLSLTNNFFF